jgi:hypothetical protein
MSGSTLILECLDMTEEELTKLIKGNPSLRGMLYGYAAEFQFDKSLRNNPDITEICKDDDHDRHHKGDCKIVYKGKTLVIEVKSLQTNTVKDLGADQWSGKAQVDGSDRRKVTFPDGTTLETTLLLRGEFDLLAVACFAFGESWRFVYAKNEDLPVSAPISGGTEEVVDCFSC